MPFFHKDEPINFYEIKSKSDQVQKDYVLVVKEKIKIYKSMFKKYANIGTGANHVANFDDMLENANTMKLQQVFKFLSDFNITKEIFRNREDVRHIIKMINLK